jgi:hypothetical protein
VAGSKSTGEGGYMVEAAIFSNTNEDCGLKREVEVIVVEDIEIEVNSEVVAR